MSDTIDVLVVDDEPIVIDSVRLILKGAAISCEAAFDSGIALRTMQERSFRLIISDIMLPRSSGLNFLSLVHERYPGIPVIMTTGYSTRENALESFKRRAFDYVPKPFDPPELLGTVRRALSVAGRGRHEPVAIPGGGVDEQRLFLGSHSWAKAAGGDVVTVGAAESFFLAFHGTDRIELPSPGRVLEQGDACARLFGGEETINTLWCPVTGRVVEINHALEKEPGLLASDPFGIGWVARLQVTAIESDCARLQLRAF